MNYYKIYSVILTVLSIVLLATTIYYSNNHKVEYRTVENTDTLEIHTIDTITIEKTKIAYRDVHILDTIYISDTSLVVEQKVFEDSLSTIYISGVNPELDSIEYRIPKDTLIVNKEIIQTVQQKESFWHNRFTISAGIFAGYGLINRQPDIFVGVGCAVRLY